MSGHPAFPLGFVDGTKHRITHTPTSGCAMTQELS